MCDNYIDVAHQKIKDLITHYHRDDDLVLVEGLETDEEQHANEHLQTRFVNKTIDIKGWHPVGYAEFQKKSTH